MDNYDPGDTNDCEDSFSSSMERALSDIEIVQSAYPDETVVEVCSSDTDDILKPSTTFPLHLTLFLSKQELPSKSAYIVLEWKEGYPLRSSLQVGIYRCSKSDEHPRLERTVQAVRKTATICFQDGLEAGLACCAAAFDEWNNDHDDKHEGNHSNENPTQFRSDTLDVLQQIKPIVADTNFKFKWMTGELVIHDRKSMFVGHVCSVQSEADIQPALEQLLYRSCSAKQLQRATHHMVRKSLF
jgi:hypothetical protein